MKSLSRYLLLPGLLLGSVACQPQQPATGATDAPASPPTSAMPASPPDTRYGVYRLLLPGQPDSLTLHLTAVPRLFDYTAGTGYLGSYYGPDGHPYALQSQGSTDPDSVVLFEGSPEKAGSDDATSPSWRLRRQPGGALAGTVGGAAVRLRRVLPMPGRLYFTTRYFADSVVAFAGKRRSPAAQLSLLALLPQGGPEAVRKDLEDNMLRDLRGDTLGGGLVLPLPQLYRELRKQYASDYRADATDAAASVGTDSSAIMGYALRYDSQQACYVLYQDAQLLTLAYFSYDYMGGAHGSYGTTGASYDLRTGRRLRYQDIFQPTAAARLPALLAQAVRPLVGVQPGAPLDEQLFVKQLPITHNVFLTAGGAEFIYQPYEIASFAQGEIRVFLPLAQLRPLLRPGLPLPAGAAASVAAR